MTDQHLPPKELTDVIGHILSQWVTSVIGIKLYPLYQEYSGKWTICVEFCFSDGQPALKTNLAWDKNYTAETTDAVYGPLIAGFIRTAQYCFFRGSVAGATALSKKLAKKHNDALDSEVQILIKEFEGNARN